MKNNIFLITISAILALTSCKSDNFYETQRTLSTDKNMYCIGDSIFVTISIKPLKNQPKEIRVFSDLRNIKLFPYSKSAVISTDFYDFDKSGEIKTITITQDNYFTTTLRGWITSNEDHIIINFDNYSDKIVLDKSTYTKSPDLAIGGICLPIKPERGAALEETFRQKEIAILNCKENKRPISLSN